MSGSATERSGDSQSTRTRLPRTVIALAAVSLLTDASSEMIYPLLPVFLSTVLGASALAIGAIEGAAESTAALLKLLSGWWSDRLARRKPLVVAGYGLASLARPLVGLAGNVEQVLALRLVDRVGKGIRTAPRDALIADSVDPAIRGRAYGFHRAADHAGAVVGPLLASTLLFLGLHLRSVFLLAAVPAALAMLTLLLAVPEPKREPPRTAGSRGLTTAGLSGTFWGYLFVLLLFTLGNSSDAFLLLRAAQLGVPPSLVPVLWSFLHVVKSLTSTPGGILSDKLGRRPMIVAGWFVYAAVYAGFAVASEPLHAWLLFAAYGIFFGLTEGVEKALVADLVPPAARGTAFGWYNLAIGIGALPASLIFGAIWDRAGSEAAFAFGASLALLASLGLGMLRLRRA